MIETEALDFKGGLWKAADHIVTPVRRQCRLMCPKLLHSRRLFPPFLLRLSVPEGHRDAAIFSRRR
jgi:hypothetical protein